MEKGDLTASESELLGPQCKLVSLLREINQVLSSSNHHGVKRPKRVDETNSLFKSHSYLPYPSGSIHVIYRFLRTATLSTCAVCGNKSNPRKLSIKYEPLPALDSASSDSEVVEVAAISASFSSIFLIIIPTSRA